MNLRDLLLTALIFFLAGFLAISGVAIVANALSDDPSGFQARGGEPV